jgi:Cd2+/Zn2+-exporting ATPase/Cu+-exporting ATPase
MKLDETTTIEIPIRGMDCTDCTRHVQRAIAGLPGVESVDVFLGSEKAIVRHRPGQVDLDSIREAVAGAGYSVPDTGNSEISDATGNTIAPAGVAPTAFTRQVLSLLGIVFGVVLFVVVVGEMLGLFEAITRRVPWPVGVGVVLLSGFPVFRNVVRATLKGQVIAHTLMSVGALAALAVGEWATAAVVVFFMRVGDYAERFTTERARGAVRSLSALAPATARLSREGSEVEVPVSQVRVGDVVVVRPGEKIPVDGEVIDGRATVDQATLTGESMPVEAEVGAQVFAATYARLGSLRLRVTRVGPDTTFGRVIQMVEEAEAHRGDVQRIADRFSGYYLPVVAGIAALTFLFRRDPLAVAAVLVVACSCSFALATPIAILASVGAGARRGLLIKGGKYLETLAKADVLLIDKTGTLTLGRPAITDLLAFITPSASLGKLPLSSASNPELAILSLAASAERFSEHPLAEAVRAAAVEHGLQCQEPETFEAIPGIGVHARLNGSQVSVGNRRILETIQGDGLPPEAKALEAQGKSLLYLVVDGRLAGLLAASDTLRSEVPEAIAAVRRIGIEQIELLTGDNERSAAALAGQLGVDYRAELLPEEKIAIVKEYQSRGHTVVMIGDGVNDAPALAQADVGMAMGAAGSAVAVEAAHIALLRDDWTLVPQALAIARRTMRVIKMNLAFTAVYNAAGLTLAALGFLPPIFAAAAQSIPDLGILANSSRLLKQK